MPTNFRAPLDRADRAADAARRVLAEREERATNEIDAATARC